jgi:hypothetical protein
MSFDWFLGLYNLLIRDILSLIQLDYNWIKTNFIGFTMGHKKKKKKDFFSLNLNLFLALIILVLYKYIKS